MKEIKIDLIKLQKARAKPGCLQGHSFGLHEEWSRVRRLGKKIGVNKKPPGIPRAKHEHGSCLRRSRLKTILLYFASQFSVYTKFGVAPIFARFFNSCVNFAVPA